MPVFRFINIISGYHTLKCNGIGIWYSFISSIITRSSIFIEE